MKNMTADHAIYTELGYKVLPISDFMQAEYENHVIYNMDYMLTLWDTPVALVVFYGQDVGYYLFYLNELISGVIDWFIEKSVGKGVKIVGKDYDQVKSPGIVRTYYDRYKIFRELFAEYSAKDVNFHIENHGMDTCFVEIAVLV